MSCLVMSCLLHLTAILLLFLIQQQQMQLQLQQQAATAAAAAMRADTPAAASQQQQPWMMTPGLLTNPGNRKFKGHGCGCTAALSGMHRLPPTSLCNDNTQNLHRSTVELIPKQCPHPRSKVNVLATHPTLRS